MPEERYPHLFLSGPTDTRGFTSVNRGGASPLPIRPSRSDHAESLTAKLNAAWNQASGLKAASVNTRDGCYLEFRSAPETDLALKSMEARKGGIRLCKVSQVETVDGSTENRALVFIPSEKRNYFVKKIQQYGEAIKDGRKNPSNQPLVAPIEDIVAAVLKDFWTDASNPIPENPEWVETWIVDDEQESIGRFRESLTNCEIEEHPDQPVLRFPERAVLLIRANSQQLGKLIENSELVCELRAAREVPTHIMDWDNRDQSALCEHLLSRLRVAEPRDLAICILDTGVNNGHPILSPLLDDSDLHSVKLEWGLSDSRGHGTLMAGLAAFGDLQKALESNETVAVTHILESTKILPPPPVENPKHLWGDVTEGYENYPADNLTNDVHDPAQSWNALSVGAFTEKVRLNSKGYEGYRPVALHGQLSPYSTTSYAWDDGLWPLKPEILMEGGNVALHGSGDIADPEDLRLISTSRDFTRSHFWPFEATSAASAQAAWLAAKIQSTYPNLWPETIRGLMIHSARWTDAMKQQFFDGATPKQRWRNLVRACGYGAPDLRRAISCVSNSLTLIAEASIQPFETKIDKHNKKSRATKEMDFYELPWPKDELLKLGEGQVEMRITLSYFIEPGPGEVGWKDRYRYASHGLRFELNGPGENSGEFVKRINKKARAEDEGKPDTEGANRFWSLGQLRNVGSIHSDIWTGKASDLASSNLIAIRPVIGWWRERYHLGMVDKRTNYSLIVSIETPGIESEIYSVVATKIGVSTPVQIEIPI